MYSGTDSTEAQSYTQWALNPSAYQNMSNDQVDWAALAQQWIIMKEAGPPVPEQLTNVPVPILNKVTKKDVPIEGGEAPMEVENDSEDVQPQWNDGGGSGDSWSWNQQSQQQQQQPPPQQQQQQQQPPWGWGNAWSAPSGVPPPNSVKTPLLPTPPAYNQYSSNDNCNDSSNYGYTSVPPSDYQGGYWTSASSSKVIKPHNKRYSKVNVPTAVATPKPVTIDAAKRKQLPAWIREGLEKMERDKLKQLDREREKQEKEEYEAKMKLNEKNALEILKTTVKEQQKSKFESEGEDSGDDTDGRPLTPEPIPLSQEELMLKVRRTMTEILLKVTNREIYNVCREELQRHVKKLKASDQRVSAPSGANLSAKLGLGAYGGTGSSSDSSDEEPIKDHHDSDADLKDTIKRRKAEFSKTEREIEDKLAEAEKEGDDSRAASPDNSDNDSQVDAKISGGRPRLNSVERTPPIKGSQNSKHRSRKTSSSSDDSDSDDDVRSSRSKDRRLTRDRRSSSTVSSRSDKYKRSRNSRSRTPDKKRKSKYSESKSRRSRSKSPVSKRRRSRSPSVKRSSKRDSRYSKKSQTRSRSRSSSRSRQRSSYDRFRRSTSRSRRSRSYTSRRRRSRSRQRTRSPPVSHKHRRSRSHSNGRGKRSHRH